ncbi:hypothetical protein [Anaerosinus massiliensis]|uniref:hypothetical protein n=1 Tax=Massilibacillus massiliensis TaxID=1806837 RepID=UPI000DA60FAF|nr:hypothetical protein [Massilibacillus massiliensis]
MEEIKKIKYKMRTISSVIVSPRANTAFYKDLNEFDTDALVSSRYLEQSKVNVIYPFYQYGEYETYEPLKAQYYLPGSSVKGALCQGLYDNQGQIKKFMVDDVQVCKTQIVLRNLYKVQYIKDSQKTCFGAFFPNIGIEMIKDNVELNGEFYTKDRKTAEEKIKIASKATATKIENMMAYLTALKDRVANEELKIKLQDFFEKLRDVQSKKDIILFGGYKGLIHSMQKKIELPNEEDRDASYSAIFIDTETNLPHGLVQIVLQ